MPAASNRGENVTTASRFSGTTIITLPDTPLLAGNPTWSENLPESLYIPLCPITDSTRPAVACENTRSPEYGATPPFARVAPAAASRCASTSSEQTLK